MTQRLLLDSRVVIGQFLRNSLFLQAFYEGRDRGGIFGKSRVISSAYVLSIMCKTPESNKSLRADMTALLTHSGQWVQPPRRQATGPLPRPRWLPLPQLL